MSLTLEEKQQAIKEVCKSFSLCNVNGGCPLYKSDDPCFSTLDNVEKHYQILVYAGLIQDETPTVTIGAKGIEDSALSGIQKDDTVNHPKHYNDGQIEVIKYIEDKGLARGFCLGNAIKYISRAGKKDPTKEIEDLEKALFYINYFIEYLKKKEG